MMEHEAYWISPEGNIYPLKVMGKHIEMICDKPEIFGLTKDYIEATFKRYNEPLGFEGKARKEIMWGLLEKGWIRIRFSNKLFIFKAEVAQLNNNIENNIKKWIKELNRGTYGNIHANLEVKILIKGHFVKTFSIN